MRAALKATKTGADLHGAHSIWTAVSFVLRWPCLSSVTMKRALAFVVMFALVVSAALVDPGLALTMAPALLLLALLATGFRPGEKLIARLHGQARRGTQRPASHPRPRLALVVRLVGRLLASGLAVRPPPSGLAVST